MTNALGQIFLPISAVFWAVAWAIMCIQSFRYKVAIFPGRLLCLTLLCEFLVLYPSPPDFPKYLYGIFVFYCLCSLGNLAAVSRFGREEFLLGTKNPRLFWPQFVIGTVLCAAVIVTIYNPPYILGFGDTGQFIVPIISGFFLWQLRRRPSLKGESLVAHGFRLFGGWIDTFVGLIGKTGALKWLALSYIVATIILDVMFLIKYRQKSTQSSAVSS